MRSKAGTKEETGVADKDPKSAEKTWAEPVLRVAGTNSSVKDVRLKKNKQKDIPLNARLMR